MLGIIEKIEETLGNVKKIVESKNNTFWNRMKIRYYISIKYKYYYAKLRACIKKNVLSISMKPSDFIYFYSEFVIFFASISVHIEDINTFLEKKFKEHGMDYSPINLNFTIENKILKRCKIITKGISIIKGFNYNKIVKTIIDMDIEKMICSIEVIFYDTSDINMAMDQKICHRKVFDVGNDGNIINPNFVLDKNLELEEIKDYSYVVLFSSTPMIILTLYINKFNFVRIK